MSMDMMNDASILADDKSVDDLELTDGAQLSLVEADKCPMSGSASYQVKKRTVKHGLFKGFGGGKKWKKKGRKARRAQLDSQETMKLSEENPSQDDDEAKEIEPVLISGVEYDA
jgi:hypothetical protein